MTTASVKARWHPLAPRSAATFACLAGAVCALTVLHLVWVNVEWSASYVRNTSYYDLGLPDNGPCLLLVGYVGGLVLCVGYRLARLPAGPRAMPLVLGVFLILQASWFVQPFVNGTEDSVIHSVLASVLMAGPMVGVGIAAIVVFLRFPYGTRLRRRRNGRVHGFSVALHIAAVPVGVVLGLLLFGTVTS